ncbi:MAG: hypothetical protein M3O84_03540 [Actinomycetota bacterium]|nr:hypothetical protein [Actinomycetota bacterium]
MKEAVHTVEGTPKLQRIDGEARGSRLSGSTAPSQDTGPHRVYSLDRLLALALAVQQLEVAE